MPEGEDKFELRENERVTTALTLYKIVNENQCYEGNGLWSRFNILVSLHMVLFGAVSFIYSSRAPRSEIFVLIMSVAGCLLSLWAIYVLRRLWLWHSHWKNLLVEIENRFPIGIVRPLISRPPRLIKNDKWYQSWLMAYTQPFMFLLFGIWLAMCVFIVTGDEFLRSLNNKVEKKSVERVDRPANKIEGDEEPEERK